MKIERHCWLLILIPASCLLALLAGCGGSGKPPGTGTSSQPRTETLWPGADLNEAPVSSRGGCSVLGDKALPGGDFTILLTDPVDPAHAPVPHNPSERLVFAQLYETLVNVTCDGRLEPGLASLWSCTQDSTVWVFTLRRDARFWDGTRITPEVIKQAWAGSQNCPRKGSSSSPWSWLNARSESVKVLDGLRLAISLPEAQAEFPTLLAHPATAVALNRDGWTWPVGSGPCRLRASTPAPLPTLEPRPNNHHPRAPIWNSLTFDVQAGQDPRDLAGRPFDLMLVRDEQSRLFFDQVPDLQVEALPWDRLYLLAISPDLNPDQGMAWRRTAGRLDPARDLTVCRSRSWPDLIFPTGPAVRCPQLTGPVHGRSTPDPRWKLPSRSLDGGAMVCPADDPFARELAERLSALHPGSTRVVSLPTDAATFTLQRQLAGAQILRLDQDFATRCLQMACLLGRASWIQKIAHSYEGEEALHRFLRPVALTRPWLVARPGLGGLRLDFDGTLLLSGLGKAQNTPQEHTGVMP